MRRTRSRTSGGGGGLPGVQTSHTAAGTSKILGVASAQEEPGDSIAATTTLVARRTNRGPKRVNRSLDREGNQREAADSPKDCPSDVGKP